MMTQRMVQLPCKRIRVIASSVAVEAQRFRQRPSRAEVHVVKFGRTRMKAEWHAASMCFPLSTGRVFKGFPHHTLASDLAVVPQQSLQGSVLTLVCMEGKP